MGLITLSDPVVDGLNATEEPKIVTNLQTCITLINGNIDAANCTDAFAKDVVEPAFTEWKDVADGAGELQPGISALTDMTLYGPHNYAPFLMAQPTAGGTDTCGSLFYLDPADWVTLGRTIKVRMRAQLFIDSVAPGGTWTVALRRYTSFSNLSTIGAGTTLLSTAFVAPTAGPTPHQQTTAAITLDTAGWHTFTVTNSVTIPANCRAIVTANLQRQEI